MPTNEDLYHYGRFAHEAELAWDEKTPTKPKPITLPDGYTFATIIDAETSILGTDHQRQFFGFVAVMVDAPRDVVVVWRGTEGWRDWVQDLETFDKETYPYANAGKVHQGFLDLYKSDPCREPLMAALEGLVKDKDFDVMHVTGHSLGGSLAVLNALDIATNLGVQPIMWTFGGPRVGNTHFKKAFDKAVESCVRVVNKPDKVPKVPPWEFGYHHVKGQYEIDSSKVAKHGLVCYHTMPTYLHMLESSSPLTEDCTPD